MAKIISASIDLAKIDKTKIVAHQNGAKYYNISIIVNDEKDKFGNDCSISNGQTKEEREAKVKATYIGNGKTVWERKEEPKQSENVAETDFNDLPF